MKVLVAEKIGASGVALLREHFDVDEGDRGTQVVAMGVALIEGPAPAGTEMSPSWSFTGAPGGSFRCALTRGASTVSAFAPCTSPRRSALADGDGATDPAIFRPSTGLWFA